MKQRIAGAICALAFVGVGTESHGQSRYACGGLQGAPVPVVESEEGVFFRVESDFLSDARIPWPIIEEIAKLSDAFESRGSKFVVVPLPTKGLVFAGALGEVGDVYGFDPGLAEWLYAETLARLNEEGVISVDALSALRDQSLGATLFATDPRLTNEGILNLADATSEAIERGPMRVSATSAGSIEIDSLQHQQIQSRCDIKLPSPTTTAIETVSLTSVSGSGDVAVVGSGNMAGKGLATEGLFEAALGREVTHIVGHDAISALTEVVAGDDFQTELPEAIVWIVPVTTDLAAYGMRPFREISGLVRRACRPLPGSAFKRSGDELRVDLSQTVATDEIGLLVRMNGEKSNRVEFVFEQATGETRRRSIVRRGSDEGTSHFLMPLSAAGPGEPQTVIVRAADGLGAMPDVAICGV